jgi:hypothetical protein
VKFDHKCVRSGTADVSIAGLISLVVTVVVTPSSVVTVCAVERFQLIFPYS